SFDELTLEVDLAYRGDLLSLPTRRPLSEDNLIEEQPFVKGLAGFLPGVYPHRAPTSPDEGQGRIEQIFDVRAPSRERFLVAMSTGASETPPPSSCPNLVRMEQPKPSNRNRERRAISADGFGRCR